MDVKQMEAGQIYTDFFMVYDRKILKTKSNKDYLVFQLGDSSAKLYCKVWDNIEAFPYQEGEVIKAEVEVISWNNTNEFSIKKHRLIKDEEKTTLESNKFLKCISKEKEEQFINEIKVHISQIKNENYKKLLDLLFSDTELFEKFKKCPAAVVHHENYIGGLLKHTYNVLNVAMSIAANYQFINRDLLITSAIFHDIGKIENYSYTTNIKLSRKGCFMEHISLGILIVSKMIDKIDGFDELNKEKLLSAILSSHGQPDYGSPIVPKTMEALILHHADLVDSRLYYFVNEIKENKDKEFIYSKNFETNIYVKL